MTLLLAVLLALPAGCTNQEVASRWDAVQEASQGEAAVSADAVSGSEFNRFFPEPQDDYDVVFTQEKDGFAEASLQADGEEAATLAVSDTVSNPSAAEKFADSSETLDGYPLVASGSEGTSILVADRFQVQVRSKIDDFDEEDHRLWLSRFDLDGLAALAD
jgi:hypothetical protein